MFRTLVVATDGSETAGRALDAAIDLSLKYDAKLCIVHVHLHGKPLEELERMAEIEHIVPEAVNIPPSAEAGESRIREALLEARREDRVVSKLGDLILGRAQQRARKAGVKKVEVKSVGGDYADGILDAIDDTAAELVVLGRRGLGKFRQMLVGSVSNKVVQHSGAAVLLIN